MRIRVALLEHVPPNCAALSTGVFGSVIPGLYHEM